MTTRERYRLLAAECFALANQLDDPEQAGRLLEMAEVWRALAERAARGESGDNGKIS